MVTPIVRVSPIVDGLPIWIQWYLRPSGDYTTFTLFPWSGFVFAGAGCGVLLEQARDRRTERHVLTAFTIAGAAALALGFATAARPSIYAQSSFWTSSPTYFAIRVGILMLGLAVVAVTLQAMEARGIQWPVLMRFGRSSLFTIDSRRAVFCHATWPLDIACPSAAIAFGLFAGLMYGAVVARGPHCGGVAGAPLQPATHASG